RSSPHSLCSFFNSTATTDIYTLSLHDALPISFPVCRAGATPRFFWAAKGSQKWGRSSPFRCFAHVQTECRSMRNLYAPNNFRSRSEEHTSELQSRGHLVCRLLLEKKKRNKQHN